jgi:hypothetical protein
LHTSAKKLPNSRDVRFVEKAIRRYGHARPSVPLSLLSPIVDLVYRGGGCTGMDMKWTWCYPETVLRCE